MRARVCLVWLALASLAPVRGNFWAKAQETLLLSRTRDDVAPPPLLPSARDPILDMQGFLPLCGNGRVDTRADYAAFYADPRNLPLRLTRQQLLPGHVQLADAAAMYNVTILADEECDDGNRLDLDGCSADCMHLDLWTSPCEVAVDNPPRVYEDIVYDARRGAMVVSALDGVYLLNASVGTGAVRAVLLAPKKFPATNLFRQADSLILYSARHQCFWRLPDGGSTLTLVRNFSGTGPLSLSGWTDRGHGGDDGSIAVHDSRRFLYFATPVAEPVACDSPALHRCIFLSAPGGSPLFACDNFTSSVRVIVTAGGCRIEPRAGVEEVVGPHGLLPDALDMTTRQVGLARTVAYRMEVTLSPPEPLVQPFFYTHFYSPFGSLLETPLSTARKLAPGVTAGSAPLVYSIGDPSLARMLTGAETNCGPGHCGFDTRLGYDLLAANPLRGAAETTWTEVLQDMVTREAARAPPVTTLVGLKTDPPRYARLISEFVGMFKWSTAPLVVLAFETHPQTRSLWAARGNRLVVIPKSGVQLQRADGRCLPGGAGLCPACQWAPAGGVCRACSEADPSSWAWTAKCKGVACSGRRLLAAATTIRFTLAGNLTAVRAAWPSAVASDGFYSVEVVTADPVAEMRHIRDTLAHLAPGVQVLTQPHERILVASPDPAPAPDSGSGYQRNDALLAVVFISIGLVIILGLACCARIDRFGKLDELGKLDRSTVKYVPARRV